MKLGGTPDCNSERTQRLSFRSSSRVAVGVQVRLDAPRVHPRHVFIETVSGPLAHVLIRVHRGDRLRLAVSANKVGQEHPYDNCRIHFPPPFLRTATR